MVRIAIVISIVGLVVAGWAAAQEPDRVQGNWDGKFTQKAWKDKPVSAKLIAQGKGGYRAILCWTSEDGKDLEVPMMGTLEKGALEFETRTEPSPGMGECKIALRLDGAEMKGKISGKKAPGPFTMARVEIKPPTLGAKPPEGAVVLMDGTSTAAWMTQGDPNPASPQPIEWELVGDGAMEVRKGNIVSKQSFGDCKMHLEFRTPFMPDKRGQARGNSGVYVFGRYEVQVLDSFGLPKRDNECGGIYKKAVPQVNACLPPTEWQTYDITFHAPKFDASGAKVKNAVINVEQNGIVIHDNVELDGPTPGGVASDESATGPLMLQSHGHEDKVQYRNIWIQPLP